MKKKMVSRPVLIVIALASVFLVSNGFAYTIADYYPLAQGFTWTYQETENGLTEEYTVTNSGFEDVNGVTTTKQVMNDGTYACLLFDSEALKIYKEVAPGFGYVMYVPPHGYFPAEAGSGPIYEYSSEWTLYDDPSGAVIDTGTTIHSLELAGVGPVSVPAGNFTGCLGFPYERRINYVSGDYDIITGVVFLAPGVGIVKDDYLYQEFNDQDELIAQWNGAQNLLSYNPFGGGGGGGG